MILPQDTKEPLVDSDTELDFDLDEDEFVPPYSPASEADAPFLVHPDDIELCPPPYSDNEQVEQEWKRPTSVRERLEKRRTRILWSCLAVVAVYTTLVTLFSTHHHRHNRPHVRPQFSGFSEEPTPSDCAVFPPGSPYPHSSTQRSSNASFLLSTQAGAELFNEYHRDAFVNGVFVTAYDADDADDDDGIYYGDHRPAPGEYVRMTVEAVYDGDDDWDMLQASKVCLQSRGGRTLEPHRPGERSHSAAVRGMGVSLSSVKTAPRSHLYFRLHVQVPRFSDSVDPAVDTAKALVPPLRLQSAAGGVQIGNVALSALYIRNRAGPVSVDGLTAEIARFETSGQIKGSVSVAKQLDVHAQAGDIDLDLSLGAIPSISFFDYESKCGPVDVSMRTAAGETVVRHSDWASCRQLRQKLSTSAGSIDIHPHAMFEGKFALETRAGAIAVSESDISDPTGQGRTRVISRQERGRWGSKRVDGEVHWGSDMKELEDHGSDMKELEDHGSDMKELEDHGSDMNGRSSLVAETRAGSVKVAF